MIVSGYRPVAFAGGIVGVEWAGAEARRAIEMAFAGLPASDDRLPDITLRVGARQDFPVLTLFEGSRCLYRGVSVGVCAHLLLQAALDRLIGHSAGGIVVHAALVGRNEAGVLLPGATGSGKTMLSAWLVRRGLGYFSDEACHIDATTSLADGFARPFCFRGSWAESLGLTSTNANSVSGAEGVSLVPPTCLNASCGGGTIAPRLIVFPRYQPGATMALTRLSPGRSATRLLETVANWRNLPDHGVDQTTTLARSVPAYHLTYGGFSQIEPLWTLIESLY